MTAPATLAFPASRKGRPASDALHGYQFMSGGAAVCFSDHGSVYRITPDACPCKSPSPTCSHLFQYAAARDAACHALRMLDRIYPDRANEVTQAQRLPEYCGCGVSLWRLLYWLAPGGCHLLTVCAGCGRAQE